MIEVLEIDSQTARPTFGKEYFRKIQNKPLEPFQSHSKGVMDTIGRNNAVVYLPHYKFQYIFTWFVWIFVHTFSLVGFRIKIVTIIEWATNYLNHFQPLGLILNSPEVSKREPTKEKAIEKV